MPIDILINIGHQTLYKQPQPVLNISVGKQNKTRLYGQFQNVIESISQSKQILML